MVYLFWHNNITIMRFRTLVEASIKGIYIHSDLVSKYISLMTYHPLIAILHDNQTIYCSDKK
ncbi:unnamed protein product [Brassica oleracea var. botrytis]